MPEVTDQIKERLGAAEVVGEYLKLERAGSNFKSLCPFHNEKTPSFMVNTERNFWYCFGCQKGGDIFTFVMEMEGLEFREALERLAEKAGVEIPRFKKIDKAQKGRKQRLFDILDWTTRFYQHQLYQSGGAEKIIDYLKKRGINDEQIANFKIGYAPNGWRNLLDFLVGKGYSPSEINATGSLVQKEGSQGNSADDFYDRFRDRIIFPVIDISGKTVGYSARVAPGGDEKSAKYINTSQTEVYDKSRVMYGLYQARTEVKKNNSAIVVEGNMDVISSFVAGVESAIAISGTALTPEHAKLIKRYAEKVKLCFDMDEAGRNAAKKSVKTCLENGLETEVISLPDGAKDVSDLVAEKPELWKKFAAEGKEVVAYFFETVSKKYDKEKPSERKKIARELLNIIKDISDPIEQSYWLKKLSALVEVEEERLTEVLEKVRLKEDYSKDKQAENNSEKTEKKAKPKIDLLQERLLGIFSLCQNELLAESDKIKEGLLDEEYATVFQQIKEGDRENVADKINEYEVSVRYSYDSKDGFVENEINSKEEWNFLINEITKERKKESLEKLTWDIRKAQEAGDEDSEDLLLEEFNRISREISED